MRYLKNEAKSDPEPKKKSLSYNFQRGKQLAQLKKLFTVASLLYQLS